jgi:hypothetical protein
VSGFSRTFHEVRLTTSAKATVVHRSVPRRWKADTTHFSARRRGLGCRVLARDVSDEAHQPSAIAAQRRHADREPVVVGGERRERDEGERCRIGVKRRAHRVGGRGGRELLRGGIGGGQIVDVRAGAIGGRRDDLQRRGQLFGREEGRA